ncbi:MAG: hypothetical protein AB1898_08195 [Acidobacteriota bacterium]
MQLKDHRFHWAGEDLRFACYSDRPFRAQYLHQISLPIGQTGVEVYEITPGLTARWVVVQQIDGGTETHRLFVRNGETFSERPLDEISSDLKNDILKKCPMLAAGKSVPFSSS